MATAWQIDVDENGLLRDPRAWSEELAHELARKHGICWLTEEHWQVIRALRAHYAAYRVPPAMPHLCRAHGKEITWVHDLFHTPLIAWLVAGLPDPGAEAVSYLSAGY